MEEQNIHNYSEALKTLGIEHEILQHPYLVKPEDVQSYFGETVADCVASLVMKAKDDFIVVLKKGDEQLNFKKLKKLLKVTDLRFTTKEEFEKITGLPFGAARVYIPHVKIYIDKNVFTREYRNGGTGNFSYTFKYKTDDLRKLPNSQIIDISEGKPVGVKRVFSGIRATGRLHLGNYLGAIKGMLALQDDPIYETVYMVADLHTLTTPYNVEELRVNRREVILDYLAAGLDPKKGVIAQQAANHIHAELAFYLSSVMTIARMQHLPTFKDKVKQYPEHATMALLNYPILMAADILLYKAELVPVGIDQEPHLEIAREIARKMNQEYGTDFPEPQRFKTAGEYVPSLLGEGKMSKSVEGSYINLTDDLETIKGKVAKIPTDSGIRSVSGSKSGSRPFSTSQSSSGAKPPGGINKNVDNILTLVELFQGKYRREAYEKLYTSGEGIRYSDLKKELADAIYKELQPFQEKREHFEKNPHEVDAIIAAGNKKATTIAEETMNEVKEKMGLSVRQAGLK